MNTSPSYIQHLRIPPTSSLIKNLTLRMLEFVARSVYLSSGGEVTRPLSKSAVSHTQYSDAMTIIHSRHYVHKPSDAKGIGQNTILFHRAVYFNRIPSMLQSTNVGRLVPVAVKPRAEVGHPMLPLQACSAYQTCAICGRGKKEADLNVQEQSPPKIAEQWTWDISRHPSISSLSHKTGLEHINHSNHARHG